MGAGKTMSPELPDFIYEGKLTETMEKNGEKPSLYLNNFKFANAIHNIFNTICFKKYIYIYDKTEHYYRIHTNEIQSFIRETVETYDVKIKGLAQLFAEMKAHLSAMGGSFPSYPFNSDSNKIPVKNGILTFDFENGSHNVTLLPHGPENLFTYVLNVEYRPEIGMNLALALLRTWVPEPHTINLIQVPAQAFVQMQTHVSLKKAYLFQGAQHSGKTSYFKLLRELTGNQFVSATSLQNLCKKEFATGGLENKVLNLYDDLSGVPLEIVETFKALSGDVNHDICHKGIDDYPGIIPCVYAFTCNRPPTITSKVRTDSAFWERWNYVVFPRSFDVDGTFYKKTFTPDLMSSFLNCIVDTIIRIRTVGTLQEKMDTDDVMALWIHDSDSVAEFVENSSFMDTLPGTPPTFYNKDKLFEAYRIYCIDRGLEEDTIVKTIEQFSKHIHYCGFLPWKKAYTNPETHKREYKHCYSSFKQPYGSMTACLLEPGQVNFDNTPCQIPNPSH